MLQIAEKDIQELVSIARQQHPIEACGVIAAKRGGKPPNRIIAMKNVAQSQCFFQFDAREQMRVWRELESRDEEPWVIFHSHTNSEAYPSRLDIQLASEPFAHYVIVSTDGEVDENIRSYRIFNGKVVEENIRIQH